MNALLIERDAANRTDKIVWGILMANTILFSGVDANGNTVLYETDGSNVTQLTTDTSAIQAGNQPVGITVGSDVYLALPDTTGSTTALWRWNGSTLTQITSSAELVDSTIDYNSPTTPYPFAGYNGDLVFSQVSQTAAATNTTLAIYDPTTGVTTTPTVPNGGINPQDFVTFNGNLYFIATDTSKTINANGGTYNPQAVYSYNGTTVSEIYVSTAETAPVDYGAGPESFAEAAQVVDGLTVFNGSLYFGGGQAGIEKLAISGNSATASLFNPDGGPPNYAGYYQATGSAPTAMMATSSYLFNANSTDGVDAVNTSSTVTNVLGAIGSGTWSPAGTLYNGNVIFTAYSADLSSFNLYETNGSSAATILKSNFTGSNLFIEGSTLYYNNETGGLGEINLATNAESTLAIPGSTPASPIIGSPIASLPFTPTGFNAASSPATVTAGANVLFPSASGTVQLDSGITVADTASADLNSATVSILNNYTQPADEFAYGDTLNFTAQNGIAGVYDANTGVLTLSGSATVAAYQTALASVTYSFDASLSVSNGGTNEPTQGGTDDSRTIEWAVGDALGDNSLAATSAISVCYVQGTRIRTDHGDVAVENLRVGDLVVTASGEARPIRWLGHRDIDCGGHADLAKVLPIRICAEALGPNRPARDLYVSPGHALCLDMLGEVLIPACALVNGATIAQVEVESVTYWHVELDAHDIIFAENQPAESYLDMGNQDFFVESDVVSIDPRPDVADLRLVSHAAFCRPFHCEGPVAEAARIQIRARIKTLGWTRDETPAFDLRLIVDGKPVDPVRRDSSCHFAIPAGAREAVLVSSTTCPADVMDSGDGRALGVCVEGLVLSDLFGCERTIDLADPHLDESGFHQLEDGVRRWTAGRARIPANFLVDGAEATSMLRVDLAAGLLPRWMPPHPSESRVEAELRRVV